MEDATDIFPKYVSRRVEKLEYPENFKFLANDPKFKPFILYMNEDSLTIYYKKSPIQDKYLKHLGDVGKGSKECHRFSPNDVNYTKLAARYKHNFGETYRKNVDVRAGFKIGNKYLVKAFFTFGQRTVRPGTVHVYQTLEVPLCFFLMEKGRKRLAIRNKLFPYKEMHLYDKRILTPNGCFVVPDGTTYVLMALQKTFFSLDVVEWSPSLKDVVPSPHVDPVRTRVTKYLRASDIYDKPIATPFIDDLDRSAITFRTPDLPPPVADPTAETCHHIAESMQWQTAPVPVPSQTASMPSQTVPVPSRTAPVPSPEPETLESDNLALPVMSESEFFSQFFIPEIQVPRTIQVAAPDFVKNYQRLKNCTLDGPPIPPTADRTEDDGSLPLDLSRKIIHDWAILDEYMDSVDNSVIDSVISELGLEDSPLEATTTTTTADLGIESY